MMPNKITKAHKKMKLSQMIKDWTDKEARDYAHKDFDIDGKTVVKYTEDFIIEKDENGNDVVVIDEDATFIRGNETVQVNVPMPCIVALGLDKSYASRRWLATDLTDAEKYAASVIRGKGAAMNLSLELKKLKIKAYNKARAANSGLSKSGNTGLTLLDVDLQTLLAKVDELKTDFSAYFTGATETEIIEDF